MGFIDAADLSASETVTIGAAGSGGATGNNAGSAGGNSTFSASTTEITADGGSGGSTSTSDNNVGAGGQGGFAETIGGSVYDSLVLDGVNGATGEVLPTDSVVFTSCGGASGGNFGQFTPMRMEDGPNISGFTGRGYGGGAGGGAAAGGSSVAGANGAPGLIIVRTYG